MEKHVVKILDTFFVTHDVKSFLVEKPENYHFTSGQATEVSINQRGWEKEKRPFTFTNLPSEDILQFIIKIYPSDKGVTNQLLKLKKNDELILHEVFGAIHYKGKGTFIAGGAGITPFIAIFRHLRSKDELNGNRLIFANKTKEDIILQKELTGLFGDDFINILSEDKTADYPNGFISRNFLLKNAKSLNEKFYVCGPPPMMDSVLKLLDSLGVSEKSIIKEDM